MTKSYLSLLILFFLICQGCEDDNNITSPHYNGELLGKWEFISSTPGYWTSLKYLIINPDNYFYFLYSYDEGNDMHNIENGVYTITGNQINISQFGIYIFTIKGDTLELTSPDNSLKFVRNNNAPDPDEWVIPIKIIKEIPLADSIKTIGDISFDGTFFWVSGSYSNILKIDTLGNCVLSFPIFNSGGVTYANGNLWVSSADTLKKINPMDGQTVSFMIIQTNYSLGPLSYEDGYIWSKSGSSYLKINEQTGEIVVSFISNYPGSTYGIEFLDSLIWTPDWEKIYSISTVTHRVIKNYQHPYNSSSIRSLGYDGKNFWTVNIHYESDLFYLEKLDMPH